MAETEQVLENFRGYGHGAETMEHLEKILSEEFSEELEHAEDAQDAFNNLSDKYGGLLSSYFVYDLSDGGSWHVAEGEGYEESKLAEYIKAFGERYGRDDIATLDDLTAAMDRRVGKDMDNAGCDAKNALRMLMDDLGLENVEFVISGADGDPRIEFLKV